jgi:hypothetical protein
MSEDVRTEPLFVPPEQLRKIFADMVERAEIGALSAVAMRWQDGRGIWHEATLGYKSEADEAAAISKLRGASGHLN